MFIDSSGFYCESKNQAGKQCTDYKVRYCCVKRKQGKWEGWSPWSTCTKTCGGGKQTKTRVCKKSHETHEGCQGEDDPNYSEMEQQCNLQDCPGTRSLE